MSTSNTQSEMAEKRVLYFECSAQEVWQCSNDGDIEFYSVQGKLNQSKIMLNFPNKV
jgi:hypothetical protein